MSSWFAGAYLLHHLYGKCLDLQVDAGNLGATILLVAAGALAELGKTKVPALVKFQAGCNHHTINIHAGLALEFEQHAYGSGIVCAAAENPAPAAQDGASEVLDETRGLLDGDGLHLHSPRNARRSFCIARSHG